MIYLLIGIIVAAVIGYFAFVAIVAAVFLLVQGLVRKGSRKSRSGPGADSVNSKPEVPLTRDREEDTALSSRESLRSISSHRLSYVDVEAGLAATGDTARNTILDGRVSTPSGGNSGTSTPTRNPFEADIDSNQDSASRDINHTNDQTSLAASTSAISTAPPTYVSNNNSIRGTLIPSDNLESRFSRIDVAGIFTVEQLIRIQRVQTFNTPTEDVSNDEHPSHTQNTNMNQPPQEPERVPNISEGVSIVPQGPTGASAPAQNSNTSVPRVDTSGMDTPDIARQGNHQNNERWRNTMSSMSSGRTAPPAYVSDVEPMEEMPMPAIIRGSSVWRSELPANSPVAITNDTDKGDSVNGRPVYRRPRGRSRPNQRRRLPESESEAIISEPAVPANNNNHQTTYIPSTEHFSRISMDITHMRRSSGETNAHGDNRRSIMAPSTVSRGTAPPAYDSWSDDCRISDDTEPLPINIHSNEVPPLPDTSVGSAR